MALMGLIFTDFAKGNKNVNPPSHQWPVSKLKQAEARC